MQSTLRAHWPEYLIEAWALGMFMMSAGLITTLFDYPGSPVNRVLGDSDLQRVLTGVCMGLTAMALIYSPWGKRSGAHMNPAVTLTFLWLGHIARWDAFFYIVAQFVGGTIGVLLVVAILGDAFAQPPVRYVATLPGAYGVAAALIAEFVISFVMMTAILGFSNSQRLMRYTGICAGILVALWISVEGPLSGMSMNPARTFASALPANLWTAFWIYVLAPVAGMRAAAALFVWQRGGAAVKCSKLIHTDDQRCIHCGYEPRPSTATSILVFHRPAADPRAMKLNVSHPRHRDVPAAVGGERSGKSHAFSHLRHSASGRMPESLFHTRSFIMSASESSTFDAVIVGSGAGGCAAAFRLASAGLRVAVVEKGRALPRDASTLDFAKVVRQGVFKSKELWRDNRGRSFAPEEYFNVGGKTKWYGAALLRYGRHEFDADPAHQCLGWPIGYDELRPYYEEAEALLGIRTFDTEPDLLRIVTRLQSTSPVWTAQPLPLGLASSILDHPLEASRFDGFASVAGLKSDGETVFLSRLRGMPNVSLLTGVSVVDLLGEAGNPLRVAGVRLEDNRTLHARSVLLAAGALHSPRILARYLNRSGLDDVLPSASIVGRNLKLHLLTAVVALSASRKTDLIRKTTLLLNDALPHSSVQPLGFDGELIGTLVPNLVPRFVARHVGHHAYGFFLQTEDGSHPDNRIVAGDQPTLDYDAERLTGAAQEHRRLVNGFKFALGRVGMPAFSQRIGLAGTAHACGTLVAGVNPHHSVVDADGRVHGMESLYVVDGSVLPRSSRVNPSLTIYSWSLRVAQALSRQLRERQATAAREAIVS